MLYVALTIQNKIEDGHVMDAHANAGASRGSSSAISIPDIVKNINLDRGRRLTCIVYIPMLGGMTMSDTIQHKSLYYLYSQLRKARIALGHAEKRNNTEEIANLQAKIEVLEWLTGIAIKEK